MVDTRVRIGSLLLKNPVMPASGCFAHEYAQAMDLGRLGALVTKSVTPKRRIGNPVPRVAETDAGMLNSIGIPSSGLLYYVDKILPRYAGVAAPVVASVSADTAEEFAAACEALSVPGVSAIEANISCPNIEADGRAFAMSPKDTQRAIAEIKRHARVPIWAKLTPNVADIAEIARAAEDAGADALVVANTLLGMAIDTETRKPKLGNVMGGLSGPAIRPIVVRMVFQCARAVRIPVIGCGGIMSAEHAVEHLLAGATAVQVGTASFLDPAAMIGIIDGLAAYCERHGVARIADLTGAVRIDPGLTDRWLRLAQQSG
ncbi:MAG: dihydroorotate dehydrogenase B catalytic subunit [Betaproteobacteria bacterium RIFCSPLOWO2_12_FULL_65_14]|nr:MAG: dihydroorotate dehydrogenase B catalytic subunit [Betaproteobacteria bacterium RIFCSPLOWO2_12_FULL_65_14]